MDRLLNLAHSVPEPDRRAMLVGSYYSAMLNSWGVALQRMDLEADHFLAGLLEDLHVEGV